MVATLTPPKQKKKQQTKGKPLRPANAPAAIIPMPGERQSQFFIRASRALRQSIPSVNRRTVEILRIWQHSQNDQDLRDKAAAMFPADKFEHFGPRCIFLEHTVPASGDGSRPEIHYGQNELQKLVDWANYRIRNSENFAALSDGHTPSQDEKSAGAQDPEVLGYSGPFYLGLLGDMKPQWAIYADEWVHTGDVPRFEKLQRRSPEVWANEPIEQRTMDPIAALGAATPRLDSGMNPYCRRATDDRLVMRYSAAFSDKYSAVTPGPMNVFVPSAGTGRAKKRDRKTIVNYSGDSDMPPVGDQSQANSPTDLAAVVGQAIQAVIPSIVQAVIAQIQGGTDGETPPGELETDADDAAGLGDGADGDADDTNPMLDDGDADNQDEPNADDTPVPRGMDDQDTDTAPGEQEGADAMQTNQPGQDDPLAKKYKAMGAQCYEAYMAGRRAGVEKYSRSNAGGGSGNQSGLAVIVARQADDIKKLRGEIARERRDAVRYSKLNELASDFAFDPKEEFETCADLTDDQFERHITKTVTKYARRDDVAGVDLFVDAEEPTRYGRGSGAPNAKKAELIERYSREAATVAARKNAKKRGSTTFEAEFDAICKQHGLTV